MQNQFIVVPAANPLYWCAYFNFFFYTGKLTSGHSQHYQFILLTQNCQCPECSCSAQISLIGVVAVLSRSMFKPVPECQLPKKKSSILQLAHRYKLLSVLSSSTDVYVHTQCPCPCPVSMSMPDVRVHVHVRVHACVVYACVVHACVVHACVVHACVVHVHVTVSMHVHGHAAWRDEHTAWAQTYSSHVDMQHGLGHVAWTWTDMQPGHGQTCSMDRDMQRNHWIAVILTFLRNLRIPQQEWTPNSNLTAERVLNGQQKIIS